MKSQHLEDLKSEFLSEITHGLDEMETSILTLEKCHNRGGELAKIFRVAHSIKGGGAVVGFSDLSAFAHKFEDLLSILRTFPEKLDHELVSLLLKATDAIKTRIRELQLGPSANWDATEITDLLLSATARLSKASQLSPQLTSNWEMQGDGGSLVKNETGPPKDATSIRVDANRLDGILDQLGELVVLKSQLLQDHSVVKAPNSRLGFLALQIDQSVREVYDRALSMRMTSLKPLFRKAQRIVRDLSVKLGKAVDFEMIGENTEIDRVLIDVLSDPIVHIARNSIDHGIETKDQRRRSDKSETARIKMAAFQENGRVVIELTDDGKGMDPAIIFEKAKETKVISAEVNFADMHPQQILQLIFLPGFSTASQISEISGRGVGLDVVKTNIEKIRGTVSLESQVGTGSKFRLTIPLTSALTDGMVVASGGNLFVIPLNEICELLQVSKELIIDIHQGIEAVNVRGSFIPLLRLRELLATPPPEIGGHWARPEEFAGSNMQILVVIEKNQKRFAMLIDKVVCQGQYVVKSLGPFFRDQTGIANGTIMGDGKVALILDSEGLMKKMLSRPYSVEKAAA